MDSLLINLRKYRPRENTDPLENFMTEAFAWLLRRNTGFSMHWLESLNEQFDDGEKFMLPTEDVLWSTQENFDGKYPDMVASWSQTRIIFEHKVWADLHENQLSNYRSYADKQSWDYRLILITARTLHLCADRSLVQDFLSKYKRSPFFLLKSRRLDVTKVPLDFVGDLRWFANITDNKILLRDIEYYTRNFNDEI